MDIHFDGKKALVTGAGKGRSLHSNLQFIIFCRCLCYKGGSEKYQASMHIYIYTIKLVQKTQQFDHQRQSKKECKDQESIQSITTPDPGYQWESDNFTIRHHKREPRGQPFPSR